MYYLQAMVWKTEPGSTFSLGNLQFGFRIPTLKVYPGCC